MPEWDMPPTVSKLLESWAKGIVQYQSQIDEAKRAGTPSEQMFGCRQQLIECHRQLSKIIEALVGK